MSWCLALGEKEVETEMRVVLLFFTAEEVMVGDCGGVGPCTRVFGVSESLSLSPAAATGTMPGTEFIRVLRAGCMRGNGATRL